MSRGRWGQDRWEPGRHRARLEHARTLQNAQQPQGGSAGKSPAGEQKPRSKEAVVKIVGWNKGAGTPGRIAAYIGRHKEQDEGREQVPLYNEKGQELRTQAQLQEELASWGLKSADQNRSAAWRNASPAERANMTEDTALARRQSVHIVFSLPVDPHASGQQVRQAAEGVLDRHFGAAGHRYLYALHMDHGRPHVHAIVKTAPETGHAKALRLGPSELDYLRRDFAKEARAQGLDVVATRRVERPELVQKIVRGEEPLRASYTKRDLRVDRPLPATAPPPPKGAIDRLTRPFKAPERFAPAKDSVRQEQAIERLRAELKRTYVNPQTAESAFKRAYEASPRQAIWAINNRPEHYGATRPGAAKPAITGRGLPRVVPSGRQPNADTPAARAAAVKAAARRDQAQHQRDPLRVAKAISRVAGDLDKAGEAGRRAAAALRGSLAPQRPDTAPKAHGRTIQPGRSNRGPDLSR